MSKRNNRFKNGVASFYIVAISTLILVIIAVSFATAMISEMTRTSNNDLAQSAYDSAMAGIEDAKLAYYNYKKCKTTPTYVSDAMSCADIIDLVEGKKEGYCDMVADILGRVKDEELGVLVQESNIDNDMQQYYTCVKMTNVTEDVLDTLSESESTYVIRLSFDDGVDANSVDKVKVSWRSRGQVIDNFNYNYYSSFDNRPGLFNREIATPAVLSVGMIQTGTEFSWDDFGKVYAYGNKTNRGTVFLVPTNDKSVASRHTGSTGFDEYRFEGSWNENDEKNEIGDGGFYKSNNKNNKNYPFMVYCDESTGEDFPCSVEISISEPVSSYRRSGDTFTFVVTLPYGGPATDFSLEFFCEESCMSINNQVGEREQRRAYLHGVQLEVDSTGRADNIYRRIKTRFVEEESNVKMYSYVYSFPLYAVQLLDGSINKNLTVTSENSKSAYGI